MSRVLNRVSFGISVDRSWGQWWRSAWRCLDCSRRLLCQHGIIEVQDEVFHSRPRTETEIKWKLILESSMHVHENIRYRECTFTFSFNWRNMKWNNVDVLRGKVLEPYSERPDWCRRRKCIWSLLRSFSSSRPIFLPLPPSQMKIQSLWLHATREASLSF